MTNSIPTVFEELYNDVFSGSPSKQTYLFVHGPSYTYAYKPQSDAFDLIRPRIKASGRVGRLAALGLGVTVNRPSLCKILPNVNEETLSLPSRHLFDAAIFGLRTKTFHLSNGLVYTFPNERASAHVSLQTDYEYNEGDVPIFPEERSGELLREAHVRQQLPSEVNVPQIIEIDEEYPYFAEQLIQGDTLTHPIRQRKYIFEALKQLRPLYETRFEEWLETEQFLSQLRLDLHQREQVPSSLIEKAFDMLDQLMLPKQLGVTQVHGDFHPANILVSTNDVYLLDWEQSKVDLTVYDFMRLFEILYSIEGDTKTVRNMIKNQSVGKEMATQYMSGFGELSFDTDIFPSGIPILYLLHRLRQINPESVGSNRCYELLSQLVLS